VKNRDGVPVDNQCFKWAVTRAVDLLHNEDRKNLQRIDTNLQSEAKKYNWSLINFPSGWKEGDMFERLNKSITVNVLGYNDGIDKNLSRLLHSQTTKHRCERYYCLRCINGFNSENSRKNTSIFVGEKQR